MKSAPASRVTIDFTTLEDQTVTVRERHSMSQIRLHLNEVPAYLLERVRWDYSG
jgi:glycyl-tRNA synthetase